MHKQQGTIPSLFHTLFTKSFANKHEQIQLFKWEINEATGSHELIAECGHQGHILALFAVSRGDFIVVGDLMKSISLLAYKPINGSIEEIARYSLSPLPRPSQNPFANLFPQFM